ncbi:Uncharacterised protein [Shigella sonnei]|nr:Uncharacterised protein [Shigella sonnei]CSG26132.1 Uncharacterised protein [Shigella sonnei]
MVVIVKRRCPAIRRGDARDESRHHIRAVLSRPACGIRLCPEPAHRIKLTLRDAAVRVFLFHHPLQPGFTLRVQHFTAVQAVGDGDAVLLILIRVA